MRLILLGALTAQVAADCYLHNPKGSNNRLHEKSANRNNGNRLFDSQNNNRGGYNVGDIADGAFANADGGNNMLNTPFTQELNNGQYSMMFYEGSTIPIEWTAQHGCGGSEENDPHKLNCNMVIQYACNTKLEGPQALRMELKDGRNTNTPDDADNFGDSVDGTQKAQNDANARGRHESEAWYYECEKRSRNKGLFTADQKLKGNAAKYTRQNPNGNRRGLECPEERDYFPYWKPTPFIDVAILTDEVKDCTSGPNYVGESQNTKDKCFCLGGTTDDSRNKAFEAITQGLCTNATAETGDASIKWTCQKHNVPAPVCMQGDWSRVNHLGNGDGIEPLTYDWKVPYLTQIGANVETKSGNIAKCMLRVRYNITTDDYDPRTTDAKFNYNKQTGVVSPVQQNPTVDVNAKLQGLKLAINTAQFGRTFQDRTHTFYIKKRPAGAGVKNIVNLNVRGKRGNIVQTFPSVEYDFVPTTMNLAASTDLVHVQWTGSNTHNNGNPAGDGQAGDAGEGTGGTDRQNIVCTVNDGLNYPIMLDGEHQDKCLFRHIESCAVPKKSVTEYMNIGSNDWETLSADDCAMYLASSGYYHNMAEANANTMSDLLNNAPASLKSGVFLSFKDAPASKGTFTYMNTRNNNFSNRSQKGKIVIS